MSFSSRGTIEYGKGGYLTGSYPWGHLESSPEKLYLTAPVFGQMTFAPEDVIAVERFVRFPVLSWGIQIRHIRPDVARAVHFINMAGPSPLLEGIRGSGFVPRAVDQELCLECDAVLDPPAEKCAKCGWSYSST